MMPKDQLPCARRATVFVLLAAMLALPAAAQTWESKQINLKPDPAMERFDLAFRFTNHTGQPLRIATVSSSCHVCLTATADTRAVAPGESGKVRASVSLAGLSGRQEKTITVTYADSAHPPDELRLILDLPNYVTVEKPETLVWAAAEPPAPKTVLVRTIVPRGHAFVESVTPEGAFTAKLGTNPAISDAFVLTVTPAPAKTGEIAQREAVVWVGILAPTGEKYFAPVKPAVR